MAPPPLVSWDRLVRYIAENGESRYGQPILENDGTDIAALARSGSLTVRVLEGSDPFNAKPTNEVQKVKFLLGPLEANNVPIIRCIGLNYKSHILESGRPLPTNPTVFTKPGPAVGDWGEKILIPSFAQDQCDYEGELTIVIGKDGKDVPAEKAMEYVAAYTCGNDLTARDWQRDPIKAGPVPQWGFSKSFDGFAPLGPCLVAGHVLGAAENLKLRTLVNGEERQLGNTNDLCFGVEKLVEFCSKGQTLQRGSLIMTGTPGGVGLFMKPPLFLNDGDEVSVEIAKIDGCKIHLHHESTAKLSMDRFSYYPVHNELEVHFACWNKPHGEMKIPYSATHPSS